MVIEIVQKGSKKPKEVVSYNCCWWVYMGYTLKTK
jgi:hypothetical protein